MDNMQKTELDFEFWYNEIGQYLIPDEKFKLALRIAYLKGRLDEDMAILQGIKDKQ